MYKMQQKAEKQQKTGIDKKIDKLRRKFLIRAEYRLKAKQIQQQSNPSPTSTDGQLQLGWKSQSDLDGHNGWMRGYYDFTGIEQ